MTAHRQKDATITSEWVERFAAYHGKHYAWGALHVQFDDDNFELDASTAYAIDGTKEEAALIDFYNRLTVSQRMRLRNKAEGRT